MKTKIEFTPGETVVCTNPRGVDLHLTLGKKYEVVEFRPVAYADNGFRFGPYLKVTDDFGDACTFHTYRFSKLDESL